MNTDLDPNGNPVPAGFQAVECPECHGIGVIYYPDGKAWCWRCPDGDGWWFEPIATDGEGLPAVTAENPYGLPLSKRSPRLPQGNRK